MDRDKVEELIARYIDDSGVGQQIAQLKEQVAELEARQGLLNLEQAEEKVESYVKQGLSHEAAFKLVVEELEEKELARKARLEQARAEKTTTQLEELSPEEELRLMQEEDEG